VAEVREDTGATHPLNVSLQGNFLLFEKLSSKVIILEKKSIHSGGILGKKLTF